MNVIVNVPSPAPVAKLGKITSFHVMSPRGDNEPVALPSSGGLSGSPPPDPVREYVTLTVLACRIGAAQTFIANTQAAADIKILEFTLDFLSVFEFSRITPQPANKVKETCCEASINREVVVAKGG